MSKPKEEIPRTQEEIYRAIANQNGFTKRAVHREIEQALGMSGEALEQILESEGVDPSDMRERIERQLQNWHI